MTTSAQESNIAIRELDHRTSHGIDVWLLWNAETKDVFVSVAGRDGVAFEFEVAPTDALEAFHHPYAYSASGDDYLPLAA